MKDDNEQVRIPIVYVDRPGFEGVEGAFRSPVIDIWIGFDPNADLDNNKPFGQNTLFSARALVDTGADDFCVDYKLLQRVGAPQIHRQSGGLKTVHGMSVIQQYRVHLQIPNTPFKSEIDVIALDIDDGTRAYNAIFGLSFLETGVLLLDPRSGEGHFTFHV